MQPRPLAISIAPQTSDPWNQQRRSCLSLEVPGLPISTVTAERLGKKATAPALCFHSHGPGPAPPHSPVLQSAQSQVPSRTKTLRPPFHLRHSLPRPPPPGLEIGPRPLTIRLQARVSAHPQAQTLAPSSAAPGAPLHPRPSPVLTAPQPTAATPLEPTPLGPQQPPRRRRMLHRRGAMLELCRLEEAPPPGRQRRRDSDKPPQLLALPPAAWQVGVVPLFPQRRCRAEGRFLNTLSLCKLYCRLALWPGANPSPSLRLSFHPVNGSIEQ